MMHAISTLVAFMQVCVVVPEAQLIPSISQNGRFGSSVDADQDRIVVGAPEEQSFLGGMRGVAYVFDRVGGYWIETAVLADSKTFPGSLGRFGQSVSLDGSQIAVGAQGQAFVFKNNGLAWNEEVLLDAPAGNLFGLDVCLSGDTLIVGAPREFYAPFLAKQKVPGLAHVYSRGPSGWIAQATLYGTPADDVGGRAFGWSVALHGDWLFVGSPGSRGVTVESGAVYVYKRNGNAWDFQQRLFASDGGPGHAFGWSLDASSGTLVVGAILATASTSIYSGAVYVFSRSGNVWIEQQKLISPSHFPGGCIPIFGCVGPHTGISVAVDGEVIAFGGIPYAHLFSLSGASWVNELQINDGGFNPVGNFGYSAALGGTTLAVGSPYIHEAVWVNRIQGKNIQPRFYCTPKQVGHCLPRIFDIGQPSVSAALAGKDYTVRGLEVRPNAKAMLFYGLGGPASNPFLGGTLCVNPPLVRAGLVDTLGNTAPCTGWPVFDFNAYIKSGVDPALVPGQQVWFQYWYREPSFAQPNNVGLTPGLSAIICQ